MMLEASSRKRLPCVCSVALTALALVPAAADAAPAYVLTDLGTLGGPTSHAYAINDRGQVAGITGVGVDATGQEVRHAFRTDPGGGMMRDLGTLGGNFSQAYGINESGQVVGASNRTLDGESRAFRTDAAGVMHEVDVPGSLSSVAYGVNNLGAVAGQAIVRGIQGPESWSFRGGPAGAGTLLGPGVGSAVNDRGQFTAGRVRYEPDGRSTDLGELIPGGAAISRAINAAGQVVGYTPIANGAGGTLYHAFRTDAAGVMTDLGSLLPGGASFASGVNDAGWVVGWAAAPETVAVLHDGERMWNLNDLIPAASGWSLLHAADINNHGQIVGTGIAPNGLQRAYLLTPVPEPASAVPLTLLAATTLLRRRRGGL